MLRVAWYVVIAKRWPQEVKNFICLGRSNGGQAVGQRPIPHNRAVGPAYLLLVSLHSFLYQGNVGIKTAEQHLHRHAQLLCLVSSTMAAVLSALWID